jgi:hypothetical protein
MAVDRERLAGAVTQVIQKDSLQLEFLAAAISKLSLRAPVEQ